MTGNLITFADAFAELKRYVDEGTCSSATFAARLAEAEQRLWEKAELRLSTSRVRIRVRNQHFPLPIEVDKILHTDIDGAPTRIFNEPYEFLSSGMGDLDYYTTGNGTKYLQDVGEFPVQFDVPVILSIEDDETNCAAGTTDDGWTLVAFASDIEDCRLTLTVRGLDRNSDEIFTSQSGVFSPGEVLGINQWKESVEGEIFGKWSNMHISTKLFKQVLRVYKPATKGPVTLYAVNTSSNQMYLLSKMTPETTVPSYRRYRIVGHGATQPGATSTDEPVRDGSCVLAIVKKRYMRASRDTDIIAVQHIGALKNMFIGINKENAGDLNGGLGYEQNAVRILTENKQGREQANGVPTVVDVEHQLSGGAMSYGLLY